MSWLTNRTVRPLSLDLAHLAEAAPLELDVADGEDLVDQEHVGLQVGGDGEAEPQVHARRVALHRRVHEPLEPGEGDDLVEPLADLASGHPEDRPVEVGVLEAGQLAVEPGADLEQRTDPTTCPRHAPRSAW